MKLPDIHIACSHSFDVGHQEQAGSVMSVSRTVIMTAMLHQCLVVCGLQMSCSRASHVYESVSWVLDFVHQGSCSLLVSELPAYSCSEEEMLHPNNHKCLMLATRLCLRLDSSDLKTLKTHAQWHVFSQEQSFQCNSLLPLDNSISASG